MKKKYVVIMAGGVGSRFWPYSRETRPKQFLDILSIGRSLLQLTYDRFRKKFKEDEIFVVTNEKYVSLVKDQLPELADMQILAEPAARNTAPCIAYATYKLYNLDPEAVCIVAPSDHLILQEDDFLEKVEQGMNAMAANNELLTLGMKPSRPDTGYGYIQFEEDESDIKKVKTFTEKPDLDIAKSFIDSGDFLWNAGIFIWSLKAIRSAFEEHLPDLDALFRGGDHHYNTKKERQFISEIYPVCSKISIDYGIIEKANNVSVLPSEFGWSDLGTWKSLYEQHEKGPNEMVAIGNQIFTNDSERLLVVNEEDKLIVLEGVEDLYVVNTEDVLLICQKDKEQEVKHLVTTLRNRFGDKYM